MLLLKPPFSPFPPGSQMESGELSLNYYLVQLQVTESKRKSQGFPQHLYAHSTMMHKPVTTDRSNTPICHTHSETQVLRAETTRTGRKSPEGNSKLCVASFPSILSHDMLMDENLISRGHLVLSFTLRHYRQSS